MGQTIVRCLTAIVIAAIVATALTVIATDINQHLFEYNMAVLHAESQLLERQQDKGL